MSINTVCISGRLTQNIELRATASGTSVLDFTVVVDERKKDQSGQWVSVPNYFNCTIFGARADALNKLLEKGMKVAVCGRLRQESWEKDGQKRSLIKIIAEEVDIMTRSNGAGQPQMSNATTYTTQPQYVAQNASDGFTDAFAMADEEIPF